MNRKRLAFGRSSNGNDFFHMEIKIPTPSATEPNDKDVCFSFDRFVRIGRSSGDMETQIIKQTDTLCLHLARLKLSFVFGVHVNHF